MPHIAAGWESHSLEYTGMYASDVKNLARKTPTGDAPSGCSKESSAVPRHPSNKVVIICKIENRAILVAASYKLTKILH